METYKRIIINNYSQISSYPGEKSKAKFLPWKMVMLRD